MTCPHPKPSKNSKRFAPCAYEARQKQKAEWHQKNKELLELYAATGRHNETEGNKNTGIQTRHENG